MDSIPTCEDQEDHVAMSTTAARRAARVLSNSQKVVAIELLGAAHALAMRLESAPAAPLGAGTGPALERLRARLGGLDPARPPAESIALVDALIEEGDLLMGLPALFPVGATPPEGE
jgi:histidine ammonia-lyase